MDKVLICGCQPSVLNGTEHVAEWPEFKLPDSFSYENVMPPVRDQGQTSMCVCYTLTSILDYLHNSLEGVSKKFNNYSLETLYNQRINKNVDGMQIKTALKYLRHVGLSGQKIANYAMCKNILSAKQAIVMNGPLAIGLPVYSNDTSFWKYGDKLYGGHAVTLVGYNRDGFILRNSWGYDYGRSGHSILPYSDFANLCFECWTITL